MADISYPTGCRALSEDLGTDELIRRLKTLAHTLQAMGQDDGTYQQFIPLALHLVDEFFLQHQSKDVQLLVACCIADMLRVYAPEAPYKDQEQIKTIFLFFIKQMNGLKDPKDPSFKRYFYLLENLAYVKSFNMCFDLEDSHEVFGQLFSMVFKIINPDHSSKVRNFMIDILSPLITEADNFTPELLDIILINIVEPNKTSFKSAYKLAELLIHKTSDSLEPVIKMFFNQVLVLDKVDKNYQILYKVYDLIYELNLIDPSILVATLPQLECKLRSTNEQERLKVVALLGRMFSEKDSQLSKKHPTLLRLFFGRFCDMAVSIRVKCVQTSMHFLLNQPHLRQDIISCLRARQHDCDENVRYEVVMAISETAKREFKIVCESEDLLFFMRERTLDKKFKIRKEAMSGLAFVYKQALCEPNDLSEEIKKSVDWIKNKVLHGYYMPNLEDRLLVERLLVTCLVPYKLSSEDRMKKLYHLLGTLDENATKAFIELQKNQMKTRKTVSDWVKLHNAKELTPNLQSQLNAKFAVICKLLPEPVKANEFLHKFSQNMRKDPSLLRSMEIILKRDVSCRECADTLSKMLKKLGVPVMTNTYYNQVKMLVERVASVTVDKESIAVLISLIEKCMQRTGMTVEVGLPRDQAGEKGLTLLSLLSYVFTAHFFTDETLRHMIALLSYDEEYVAPYVLKSLTHLGRYKPLSEANPKLLEELVPICKEFALNGNVKQAKHAVRCIFINSQSLPDTLIKEPIVHPVFNDIIETLRTTLLPNCEQFCTKIVTLGHIAFSMPIAFALPIKNMIARRIVKDLLIQDVPEKRSCTLPAGAWCDRDELPQETLCKLDGFKTMARWLIGLRSDEHAAQKTFRMLTAFINQRGDLLEQNRLCPAEKSWLRLGAACAMLKVCEQKGVGDHYTAEQFYNLSQLMCDPVPTVREMFVRKLHKGLGKGLPNKCLPLDFLGFYALAGKETHADLLQEMRHFVEIDVNRRREYMKNINVKGSEQWQHISPDFMLAFAIPVIAHDPTFTDYQDQQQLKIVEKCLRFILEPLMANREAFSYFFYKKLIEMMKNYTDNSATLNPDDNPYNYKMWAACDIAMYILTLKIGQCDVTKTNAFISQIKLPTMYFKPPLLPYYKNTKQYIPADLFVVRKRTPTKSVHQIVSHAEKRESDHFQENEDSPKDAQDDDDDDNDDDNDDNEDNDDDDDFEEISTVLDEEPAAKRTRIGGALRTGKSSP